MGEHGVACGKMELDPMLIWVSKEREKGSYTNLAFLRHASTSGGSEEET